MKTIYLLLILSGILLGCQNTPPPAPFGPLPSEGQLAWQEMEMNMFVHFNMNTFSNMEWGTGAEKPEQFNPTHLDTRQWAAIAKNAGMKGIILTAKHHDGFCLWPSEYTEHSVKNSSWREGKGDLVKELAEACQEYGLKMGLYLSPWDRNHADYGKPEYIDYFRKQMKELLTQYGEVFEFWIDGANGGSGYYGGANETRKIDRDTYYQWEETFEQAFRYNPNLIIFSDGGPGCRWVGNEQGIAAETNWSLLRKDDVYPGYPNYQELPSGHRDGDAWIPAEVDVSIRPGWYYHEYEDHKVKTLPRMIDLYYQSVGRNGLLLLNFPVDKRGLIHPVDSARIMELAGTLKKDFAHNLAKGSTVNATNTRGGDEKYRAENAFDDNPETYWATDDEVTAAGITIDFEKPTTFNRFLVQEYIALGQRVEEFTLEAMVDGTWQTLAAETTIGYKRILRLETVTAEKVRFTIVKSRACPVISNIQLFHAPRVLVPPVIKRDKSGAITLEVPDEEVDVYYTLDDGSTAVMDALEYEGPFVPGYTGLLGAISKDPETGEQSQVSQRWIDIPRKDWKVVSVSSGNLEEAGKMIDEDPSTFWATGEEGVWPREVVIDLGGEYEVRGITYLPAQERYPAGFIQEYEIHVSQEEEGTYRKVASGEFSNILNNPTLREISFDRVRCKYIKFRAVKPIEGHTSAGFAEVGVLTGTGGS